MPDGPDSSIYVEDHDVECACCRNDDPNDDVRRSKDDRKGGET